MGAWGAGSFENDDASDWSTELVEGTDLSAIRAALGAKEIEGYYLEVPEGSRIIAASEVLAALLGRPSTSLPAEVSKWVAGHRALDASGLVTRALQMIDRVLAEHSELEELWRENADEYSAWRAGVIDLRDRVAG